MAKKFIEGTELVKAGYANGISTQLADKQAIDGPEARLTSEEKEVITYTWSEPRVKDPGADYKPGRFKHLDQAIKNSKKD